MINPEQIMVALRNTHQQPRNHAPVIHAALKRKPGAEAGLPMSWRTFIARAIHGS